MHPPFRSRPGLTLVGHRGSGAANPQLQENSLKSFRAAHQHGLQWVEMDVRQTKDGALVVWHDELLTDGSRVASLTEGQLPRDIPLLKDILNGLPAGLAVDLDIKNSIEDALRDAADTTAVKAARMAMAARQDRDVLLTSFDPALTTLVRPVAGDLPLGLLTWREIPLRESLPTASHLSFDVLAPHIDALKPHGIALGPTSEEELRTQVEAVHRLGLQLLAWVAPADDLRRLEELGVDAACVDDLPSG
jgi:glycerophosphoryl diester phosphodiesterase